MHNIRTCSTPCLTVLSPFTWTSSSRLKAASSHRKMFQGHLLSTSILLKRTIAKSVRLSGYASHNSCKLLQNADLVLIQFYNGSQKLSYCRPRKWQMTWHHSIITEGYWEVEALSIIIRATSYNVSFETRFHPFTLQQTQIPRLFKFVIKFVIVFFKACLDIGPFRNVFRRHYSCSVVGKLLPSWQNTSISKVRYFFSKVMVRNYFTAFTIGLLKRSEFHRVLSRRAQSIGQIWTINFYYRIFPHGLYNIFIWFQRNTFTGTCST